MAEMFKDLTLTWRGRKYTLPANRAFKCIGDVERVLSLGELHRALSSGDAPYVSVSEAYALILQHAGDHDATGEEIYAELFSGPDSALTAAQALQTLVTLMVPPGLTKRAQPELPPDDAKPT